MEVNIQKAHQGQQNIIADIASRSFRESHGSSSPEKDLEEYIATMFSPERIREELVESNSVFYIAFVNDVPAAYSKVKLDLEDKSVGDGKLCKMDRLYVLKEFYECRIGKVLMDLNLRLAAEQGQSGMRLFVWKGNARAIRFYEREGFKRIGETHFRISDTHSNPNWIMYRGIR